MSTIQAPSRTGHSKQSTRAGSHRFRVVVRPIRQAFVAVNQPGNWRIYCKNQFHARQIDYSHMQKYQLMY